MGPLGELGALFNPGMRHEIEERASKANRREEEGNARDGDLRIDLASGVAVINVPGKSAGDPAPAAGAAVKPTAAPAAEKRRRSAPAGAGRGVRRVDPPVDAGQPRQAPVPSSKASRAAR